MGFGCEGLAANVAIELPFVGVRFYVIGQKAVFVHFAADRALLQALSVVIFVPREGGCVFKRLVASQALQSRPAHFVAFGVHGRLFFGLFFSFAVGMPVIPGSNRKVSSGGANKLSIFMGSNSNKSESR